MIKNIIYMIAAFGAVTLASCEEVYTKGDELFYQISEVDSSRCMEEIIGKIRKKAKENQDEEDGYRGFIIQCGLPSRDFLQILISDKGKIILSDSESSTDITESIVDHCMVNRNLAPSEISNAARDWNYKGFNHPFYNYFSMEEIDENIERTSKEHRDIGELPNADPELINYYQLKVTEWELKKKALLLIKSKFLPEMTHISKIEVAYFHPSKESEEVLNDAALAFYHLRNIECLRYFGETYLSLYDRFQRKKQPIDKEKLEALEIVRPIALFDKNLEVSPRSYWPEEEPPFPR